ncbi:hypothetical protein XENOCAPTIV_001185, partial [Xenoophorus captivus]
TTRINIFCLGYLVACFYFMLFGGSVLMQPVRYILRLWDWLIAYTCFVITMKNVLSRRVFLSYYFLYVVSDLKSAKILASRGAELFEAKVKKQVAARLKMEQKSVEALKRQMEKIKSKQKAPSAASDQAVPPADQEQATLDDEEKAMRDGGKWWKPWVSRPGVENNCGYHLFESDSEEEEEEATQIKEEEEPPKKKSALQWAYNAWTTSSKSALKDLRKERKKIKKDEKKRAKTELQKQQGIDRTNSSEDELDESAMEEEGKEERENILQRILNMLKFSWVFLQSLIDDLTDGLNAFCKDSRDISKVLRLERALLNQQQKKGKEVSQESVKQFYETWISRQNTLSSEEGLDALSPLTPPAVPSSHHVYAKLKNQASKISWGSSFSSCMTDETMLGSRQPTQEELDEPPGVPSPPQLRRRLIKEANIDQSSFDSDDLPQR